ncbi:MAG: M3 family oligoendopeptidase [Alphaproteobacteria bacterium]|nr:M3 family oligoendopeptidase [Alphaproteobacteria bacterium]
MDDNTGAALPQWDLSDLYSGPESTQLKSDLEQVAAAVDRFATDHKDKVAALSGEGLAEAIVTYERIQDVLGRIISFAQLRHAGDLIDPANAQFVQNVQERVNQISTRLLFFTLELNRLDDAAIAQHLKVPQVAHYAPWIRDLRAFRPHELSDDLERLLHEKRLTGAQAWNRLFDETLASLRFPVGEKALGLEEVLHLLSDKERANRQRAAESLAQVFGDNVRLFALITNTLAKDKEIEDRWRRFPSPSASRHLSNFVEPEVVEALVSAVRAGFPRLSHRYYRLKAKWMGLDHLEHWDRNAPLPGDDDRHRPWTGAVETVLAAYRRFSPTLADLGSRFFANRWIDAPVRPGKATGAFAHPTVPSAHPYLLLNYQGRTRDVMTLAHELGHGVHQLLAAGQGPLMADTPLTLAETASVFGEQLTFRALVEGERDPSRRRLLIAGKVEDMINTVVRQVAFYEFERRLHDERRQGELTADRIGEIWLAVQGESLGPAVCLADGYRTFWAYIPHFVHSPFYVYAYAFGDCLVNALYAVYQSGAVGFEEKYLAMLRAGGTLRHRELLAPFGLDAGDPGFWSKGLSVISGLIDELEGADGA